MACWSGVFRCSCCWSPPPPSLSRAASRTSRPTPSSNTACGSGARSSGLGQAANGVGKILGPLALALLAGSDNIIAPQATADAVFPAFVFLGAVMLAVAMAYVFLGVETHGRAIALGADGEETARQPRAALGM